VEPNKLVEGAAEEEAPPKSELPVVAVFPKREVPVEGAGLAELPKRLVPVVVEEGVPNREVPVVVEVGVPNKLVPPVGFVAAGVPNRLVPVDEGEVREVFPNKPEPVEVEAGAPNKLPEEEGKALVEVEEVPKREVVGAAAAGCPKAEGAGWLDTPLSCSNLISSNDLLAHLESELIETMVPSASVRGVNTLPPPN